MIMFLLRCLRHLILDEIFRPTPTPLRWRIYSWITTPVCPRVNNLGFQRGDGQLVVVWLECDSDKHLQLGEVRLDIEVPKN